MISLVLIGVFAQNFFKLIFGSTTQINDLIVSTQKINSLPQASVEPVNQKVDQSGQSKVSPFDEQQKSISEIKNWEEARGYSTNEYDSYSEETLLSLAKNGDVRALTALGNLRYGTIGYDGAAPAYFKAATQGSTAALLKLATIEEISHFDKAKSEEEKKKYALSVMAWYRLANMRGDRWPEISNGRYFIESKGIIFTEQDNKSINDMAINLYKDMLKSRIQLGLGEFDNSVPNSVTQKFNAWERGNRIRNSTEK